MIEIVLPDGNRFNLKNAVFDYNGTLAVDGRLTGEVKECLAELAAKIAVHVVTADTFGLAREELAGIPGISLLIIKPGNEAEQKANFVRERGAENTVCVGNGANDARMFEIAALAIAVAGQEGAYVRSLERADIVVTRPADAIKLLLNPKRIVATLRS